MSCLINMCTNKNIKLTVCGFGGSSVFRKCVQEMIVERRVGHRSEITSQCVQHLHHTNGMLSHSFQRVWWTWTFWGSYCRTRKKICIWWFSSQRRISAVVILSDYCPFKSHLMRLWFTSVVENLLLSEQLKTFCAQFVKNVSFSKRNDIFICFSKSEK